MTVRSAVLFKVISVLSVATSIQCSASRASSVGLHINTANGLLANEQYFAVGLLTMLAFFLVARVSIKYGVTT